MEFAVPPTTPKPLSRTSAANTTQAVDQFMSTLEHAFKDEIQVMRSVILATDPSIAEGIKWNSPSFRTTDYFATTNLRQKGGIGLILHLGTKVREIASEGMQVDDPQNLLKWLAKDRAMVVFTDMNDLKVKTDVLEGIICSWISYV